MNNSLPPNPDNNYYARKRHARALYDLPFLLSSLPLSLPSLPHIFIRIYTYNIVYSVARGSFSVSFRWDSRDATPIKFRDVVGTALRSTA